MRLKGEMQTWIYEVARSAKVSENKVIVRMLQVAREDLAGLDLGTISRLLHVPWHEGKRLPALRERLYQHGDGRLSMVGILRLSVKQKQALRAFAKRKKMTMSGVYRAALEAVLAGETD